MATLRTEITEIVTGLGMLGFADLDQALETRPARIGNVGTEHFDRLALARSAGTHDDDFTIAWTNGAAFAAAEEGLRGRPPWRIEWKGPHRPPGYEQIPADLRIDHVFLVSCKYRSVILHNVSPGHLFDRHLAEKRIERGVDWFAEIAPEAYQDLYSAYRRELDLERLPDEAALLTADDRARIKAAGPRGKWPGASAEAYQPFTLAVAQASAERWRRGLPTGVAREEMLWRLIRLQAAPYFVLGATSGDTPLRYRVGTPWDFRDAFDLVAFDVWPDAAGQPLVRWRADVIDRTTDARRSVEGHVEIRWSHGRFAGVPEAKILLDTDPHEVPGYWELR